MDPVLIRTIGDGKYHYDVSKKLGSGNYGEVYKGWACETGEFVAVKKMHLHSYERENFILKKLSKYDHPNIIHHFDSIVENQNAYLIFEYMDGDLRSKIDNISEIRAVSIFKQILMAVAFIHSKNIMHRDLKPANILIDNNGTVKVADFGISTEIALENTEGQCTKLYGAPQILKGGNDYNEKVDVWSIGIILYEVLTGGVLYLSNQFEKPTKQPDTQWLKLRISELQYKQIKLPQNLEPEWKVYIKKMLKLDPILRPSSKSLCEQFLAIQNQLRQKLFSKYQIDMKCLEDNQHFMSTTTRVIDDKNGPYTTIGLMKKKLQLERSTELVDNIRKWLLFCRIKNQYYAKLPYWLKDRNCNWFRNVTKYCLMFVSGRIFVLKCNQMIKKLEINQIEYPGTTVDFRQIESVHEQTLQKMIQNEKNYLSQTSKKFNDIILAFLKGKIQEKCRTQEADAQYVRNIEGFDKLLQYPIPDSHRDMKEYFNHCVEYFNHCVAIYREIPNKLAHKLQKQTVLREFTPQQLLICFRVQLIGRLNQYFQDTQYRNEDYLIVREQKIRQADKLFYERNLVD